MKTGACDRNPGCRNQYVGNDCGTCPEKYAGQICNSCNDGHYGYPNCHNCECNIWYTVNTTNICDKENGACPCTTVGTCTYTGRQCSLTYSAHCRG